MDQPPWEQEMYVFALMFLYAPSHKNYGEDQSNGEFFGIALFRISRLLTLQDLGSKSSRFPSEMFSPSVNKYL